MEFVISALLLLIALFVWRAILRVERAEGEKRQHEYDTQSIRRAVRRHSEIEADCLLIWQLQCSGFSASRRVIVRSHEMSAYRWNRAMRVITHLRLDPKRHSYQYGVDLLQTFCATQEQLATRPTYVAPVE